MVSQAQWGKESRAPRVPNKLSMGREKRESVSLGVWGGSLDLFDVFCGDLKAQPTPGVRFGLFLGLPWSLYLELVWNTVRWEQRFEDQVARVDVKVEVRCGKIVDRGPKDTNSWIGAEGQGFGTWLKRPAKGWGRRRHECQIWLDELSKAEVAVRCRRSLAENRKTRVRGLGSKGRNLRAGIR